MKTAIAAKYHIPIRELPPNKRMQSMPLRAKKIGPILAAASFTVCSRSMGGSTADAPGVGRHSTRSLDCSISATSCIPATKSDILLVVRRQHIPLRLKGIPFVRVVKALVITIALGMLGVALLCIGSLVYDDMQLTASQQLLRFADLPTDLQLPSKRVGAEIQSDYQPVHDALLHDIPLGSPKSTILAFLQRRGKRCEQQSQVITCQFESDRFPCHSRVVLQWFLTTTDMLKDIQTSYDQTCL